MSYPKQPTEVLSIRVLDNCKMTEGRYILSCALELLKDQLKTQIGCDILVYRFGTRLFECLESFEK